MLVREPQKLGGDRSPPVPVVVAPMPGSALFKCRTFYAAEAGELTPASAGGGKPFLRS